MENNIDNSNMDDFKKLWAKQTASPPDIKDLLSKMHQLKKARFGKLLLSNFLLIATSVFILYIWYAYQPQLVTTKLGIILVIMAMVVFLLAYNQQIPFLNKLDAEQSNENYLKNLLALKTKEHFLQTTMMNLYFAMLSTGICLYMYEYALMMTMFWGIFAYVITVIWIGFNWFYIRPKTIQKQEAKLDEIIRKFESVQQQFK